MSAGIWPSSVSGRRSDPTARRWSRQARTPKGEVARPQESEQVTVIVESMTVVAIICVWLLAQVLVLGGLAQNRAQANLYGEFREQLAAATAPTGGIIAPGSPVALITIPEIGLQQVVVEGTGSGTLLAGPGHRRDTVLPGQEGRSMIFGRARSYGGPFADVTKLTKGQTISTVTAQGRATYTVESVRRAGDLQNPALAAGGGRLTLVTAEGSGLLAALTPSSVVYVDAKLSSTAFKPPSGRLNAISPIELPMARDTSAIAALALALGALAVVTVCVVLAKKRFGTILVWVISVPVVLALAWSSTDLMMYLLPNLL
ncbi:sortase [soil metagenome]